MSSLEAPYRCTWTDYPRSTRYPLCPTTETRWFSKTDPECSTKSLAQGQREHWDAVKVSLSCTALRLLLGVTKKDSPLFSPPSQKPTPLDTICSSPPPVGSICSMICGWQPRERVHKEPYSVAGGAINSTLPNQIQTYTESTGTENSPQKRKNGRERLKRSTTLKSIAARWLGGAGSYTKG